MDDRQDKRKGPAKQTPVGLMPRMEDLNFEGLHCLPASSTSSSRWTRQNGKRRPTEIEAFYNQFGDRLPKALTKRLAELKANLSR